MRFGRGEPPILTHLVAYLSVSLSTRIITAIRLQAEGVLDEICHVCATNCNEMFSEMKQNCKEERNECWGRKQEIYKDCDLFCE